jgi:hypothetical protein
MGNLDRETVDPEYENRGTDAVDATNSKDQYYMSLVLMF